MVLIIPKLEVLSVSVAFGTKIGNTCSISGGIGGVREHGSSFITNMGDENSGK